MNGQVDGGEKQRALTDPKMELLEKELSNIVGLKDLKEQLRTWTTGIILGDRRRALRHDDNATPKPIQHMAFLGNPGTGKTMIARLLGKLLKAIGMLPNDKVIEVQLTDLVGEHACHTRLKTKTKIREAEGGILFVDQAHRFVDLGVEALEEIISVMDTGNIMVIFAGYSKLMNLEGFRKRVIKKFDFLDYTVEEFAEMLHIKMNEQGEDTPFSGFKLHESCTLQEIASLMKKETTEKQRKEMNGGLVDIMFLKAEDNLHLRLYKAWDDTEICTIKLEDLEAGLRNLPH